MIERRHLLKGAAAALTTSLFTGRVKGANDRIATGHIGIGAQRESRKLIQGFFGIVRDG